MSAILLLAIVGASLAADSSNPFPTSVNGNIGLVGSGYGDVYGGKIKEGVYGMGGRVGGNLGLVGGLGLGRKRREAALNTASASAGAFASGPDAFSMAGAAAGSAILSFGNQPEASTPAATTAAPAASTAAPTKKPCSKRRRRSVPVVTPVRNETLPSVLPSLLPPPIYPFPLYPMMLVPTAGFQIPPIPDGVHGVSAQGRFKFEGTATVDNDGQIRITGTKLVDGDSGYF